jgi:hypothetical protein
MKVEFVPQLERIRAKRVVIGGGATGFGSE